MTLQEVRDKVVKLGTDCKAILDSASNEGRALNADEKSKFDAIDKDRDELLETEKRMAKQDEIEARPSTPERRPQSPQPTQETQTRTTRQVSSREQLEGLRSWLLAGSDAPISQAQRDL